MDSESNRLLPLEERTVHYQKDGVYKEISAINALWVEERVFPRYVAPPITYDGTLPLGAEETWVELTDVLNDDLTWLLNLPHHCFWSQIIITKKPLASLTSFLQEAPPAYCKLHLAPKLDEVINNLSKVVFLIYSRLSNPRESAEHFITPSVLGEILYNNYILTCPSLLDLCALYGESNKKEVKRILHDVISMQPKYLGDFANAEPHLVRVLENAGSVLSLESNKLKLKEVEDMAVHVYDSLFTIRIFFEILPNGSEMVATPRLLSSIASFYTTAIPKIVMNPEINAVVDNLRIECLRITRTVVEYIINRAIETKKSEYVEKYLTLISEIMQDGLFICDYHEIYPIDVDFDTIQNIFPDMDTLKLEYLLEALACHVDLKLIKEEPAKSKDNILNYPTTSKVQEPSTHVSGVEFLSLITEVQDILPHLGAGFIEACLKHYKYNTERVISAVLESSLPSHLEELPWDMPRVLLTETEQNAIDVNINHTGDDNSIIRAHKGKKPRDHRNVNEMLADKKEVQAMKDKFASLGFVEDEYDDEYDDTYESQDVEVREPDEMERRAFVVPRVLQPRELTEVEEEDDNEDYCGNEPQRNPDHFIENPEEIRARAEQRRAQTREHRDVVGRAMGQGQEKHVLINREKKNVHKASGSNHHRRKGATRKRNQGMIPS